MTKIKLIIFDLDGVLVDACEWHRVALNRALQEMCNYQISLKDHYETFNGLPTKVKLKKLSDLGAIDRDNHDQINSKKQEFTVEIIKENAKIREEKIELIKFLKNRDIIVACYTNSIRKTAELMLKKTGIYNLFDYVLTNQEVKNSKPSPEGYNFLVNHYNLDKKEVLIVEDSPKGKQAAYSSGCNVVEVQNAEEVKISLLEKHVV